MQNIFIIVRKDSKSNAQRLETKPRNLKLQEPVTEIIENEIECPRCYDVMTLCSDFDNLYYLCGSCDFYLYTIKR